MTLVLDSYVTNMWVSALQINT